MKRMSLVLLAIAFLTAGCEQMAFQNDDSPYMESPAPASGTPEPAGADYRSDPVIESDHQERSPNAVKEALGWARKYMEQGERMEQLRRQYAGLQQQYQQRQQENTLRRAGPAAARKDPDNASRMMMELKDELKQWKVSVLGYRREVLDALEAQLEGTNTILKFLGYQAPDSAAKKTSARRGGR